MAFAFAAFCGIAAGSQFGGAVLTAVLLAFTDAIVLGWSWITVLMLRLLSQVSE